MAHKKFMSGQELWDLGLVQEVNRVFFHPLGMNLCVDLEKGILKVADYRQEIDGVVFAPGVMDPRLYARFLAFVKQRSPVRERRLGFFKQPAPIPPATKPPVRSIPARPFSVETKTFGLR